MSKRQNKPQFDFRQAIKKFLLSSSVVFAFTTYVILQRFTHPDSPLAAITPTAIVQPSAPPPPNVTSEPPIANLMPAVPVIPTQPPPTATSTSSGRYKDGTYQGPTINVFYGVVTVQATIQNGSIVNVQFLQYPNDRRTSVRINNIAMPYLQQEAIQAQSAHINLISGATLTSEGFAMSLDAALKSAVN